MLSAIAEKMGGLIRSTWVADVTAWGELVALYREYAEGNHRAKLTQEMREMLRISDGRNDQFTLNYCDMVVQTMADRLRVASVDGDNDAATRWAADVLAFNRMDGLQMDIHDAAIRDGVTYAMVAYDNDAQMPVIVHEPAWDGEVGMIAVYDRAYKNIVAAVKVWQEVDHRRANIYFADRVERYSEFEGQLQQIDEQAVAWVDLNGGAVGVPVVAFMNRAKSRMTTGISELASVIPMQDALNRTLVSMVMTSELTAFQLRIALGFPPPRKVTPGMWIVIGEQGLDNTQQVDARVMEQGQLVPFLNQAQFLIDQISMVSRTPLPTQMGGDNASGEAIKQREIGLLGKVERFKIKGGNAWEDVLALAARVQQAFGRAQPPVTTRWYAKWEQSEIRNDAEVVANAIAVREIVGDAEVLRLIAPVFDYDEVKIAALLEEKEAAETNAVARLPVPGFDQFGV